MSKKQSKKNSSGADDAQLHKVRHSLSHLLATAVLAHHPKAKLGIGPVIEHGFYYDFDFPESFSDKELARLEKDIKKLIAQHIPFKKKEVSYAQAKKLFADSPYKLELIEDLKKDKKKITVYESGDFIDLCSGPHIKNTKEINPDAFALTHIAGAYWRGDEHKAQLTRIYGLAFDTKNELDEYQALLKEAQKRDHRKLGKDLGLFVFSDVVGKGLPLWTAKGAIVRRELEQFIVEEELRRGYEHVYTPELAHLDLYRKSGHYPYYKDSMYPPMEVDGEEFMLRPMTCPHHFELYLSKPRSYKELPMRIAELAKLFRYEQSGELSGLLRVRSFCLADAHIICADDAQAKQEIAGALDLIEFVAKTFGLAMGKDYSYRLSLGNRKDTKKYYKAPTLWARAEKILREVLTERSAAFVEAKDEAAFYGPKIDVQMKNVLGKEETAFTVQYDFVMPKRFNLTYIDKNGKDAEAVVVHRSSVGAIERTIAFLIERWAGAFPVWMAPVQVALLPVSEKHLSYAKQIEKRLGEQHIRVSVPEPDQTLGKRIRETELQKIPYTLIVGDNEKKGATVSVRSYKKGDEGVADVDVFVERVVKERDKRK
jgi:threonyl-tRNA synthetase